MKGNKRSKLSRISAIKFLRDHTYDIIKEAIVSLKLRPGERLKVAELARELGTSATPIRETLARLEQEGLVKTIRFKGAFVAQINDQDVEEIFDLRELLEGAAVKKAATTFSSEDLRRAEAFLERMRMAYNTSDIGSYAKASRDFHNLFIEKFRNQRMVSVLKTFDDQLERVRLTAIRTSENIPLFIEDYAKILEALKAKNPRQAEKALVGHLKRAKDAFSKSRGHKEANQ
jgi:DNA-binding GntR family transcriptional regulator